MKTHISWICVCFFVGLVTAYWFHGAQSFKIDQLNKKNDVLIEKNKELSQIQDEGSAKKNKAFFEAFLNYSDIDKRYDEVKKYTTEKGFDYAFPSRSDKKHSISVQSKLRSLESYSKPIDDSTELFLNIVEVSTTANSVTSQQVLIVQTKMKKEKNKWLVDDVQVKGNG
ncbi:hypothetical protein NNG64_19785 [Bacillus siamensis]|uniref:Uncharacterized protein n=1 Tax=Bacillus siamensis TaxID=659243 RepID=A0AAI8HJW4_9BACI|nr:hypothetical protein [Bacillus siamensis]AUJ75367.1 hypothetical protein CWD84_00255 [Bacillus siamensis]UUA84256.1 hypothetical protein NNG64_19785 [Bacillus siamensis]